MNRKLVDKQEVYRNLQTDRKLDYIYIYIYIYIEREREREKTSIDRYLDKQNIR